MHGMLFSITARDTRAKTGLEPAETLILVNINKNVIQHYKAKRVFITCLKNQWPMRAILGYIRVTFFIMPSLFCDINYKWLNTNNGLNKLENDILKGSYSTAHIKLLYN